MFDTGDHGEVERPQDSLHLLDRGPAPALPQLANGLVELLRGDRALSNPLCGATADVEGDAPTVGGGAVRVSQPDVRRRRQGGSVRWRNG
jgi:hypothetical protein